MKPMLAGKYDETIICQKLPIIAQPKLDGIRLLIRDGIAWTRSLKPLRSTWVQSWVGNHKEQLDGLDLEIVTGSPVAPDAYRRTSSAVMSYDNNDALNSKFYVFDKWDSPDRFIDRYLELETLDLPSFCEILETVTISTMGELSFYETNTLKKGHEGVILRDPEAYYKFGRSTPKEAALIKMKRFLDTEATIVATHELRHNANEQTTNELGYSQRSGHQDNLVPMDTLGAIQCVGHWPDGSEYEVRIGTGFDEETRLRLWREREQLIGRVVKFKYFPTGVKEAPRFPVFLGFRDPDDMDQKPENQQLSLF